MNDLLYEDILYINQEMIYTFCGIGGGVVILLVSCFLVYKRHKKKKLEEQFASHFYDLINLVVH